MSVTSGKVGVCPKCSSRITNPKQVRYTEVCGFKAKYHINVCKKCGWDDDARKEKK